MGLRKPKDDLRVGDNKFMTPPNNSPEPPPIGTVDLALRG